MLKLNARALRGETHAARPETHAVANDLVRETLSRHGLMPRDATFPFENAHPGSPGLDASLADTLNRALSGLGQPIAAETAPTVPEGATFQSVVHQGRDGSRRYYIYVPSTASQGLQGVVMMLHGCTQTAPDFASGTGMNMLAERHRLVVIYPEQCRGANAQTCWNWFAPSDQQRGRGEPEILASIAQRAMAEFDVGPERCFVAGLSAGGAMAAILGETYGAVFSAVAVHSGLPCGAARDVPSAFQAMASGQPGCQTSAQTTPTVRQIVFHGSLDRTVHPQNGDAVWRRALDMHGPQTIQHVTQDYVNGRNVTRQVSTSPDGRSIAEHWLVEGLGHAWSGGQPGGSHTDPAGPDASAEFVRFFLEPFGGDTHHD